MTWRLMPSSPVRSCRRGPVQTVSLASVSAIQHAEELLATSYRARVAAPAGPSEAIAPEKGLIVR